MRKHKLSPWLDTSVVLAGVACVLAVFFTTVSAKNDQSGSGDPSGSPQEQAAATQTYEGVVTDTHCGAKHTPAIPESAGDCTRACVHSGEHFALVNGDKLYVLEGENQLLNHAAGERVTITGTLNGNIISVSSVR
jgi:uncharacterized low-complexity protein